MEYATIDFYSKAGPNSVFSDDSEDDEDFFDDKRR